MMKQIQMDMSGIIMFMVFMDACAFGSCPVVGFILVLTFMLSQERPAEMKGIRNRPSAGSHTEGLLQSVSTKKFHFG